MDNMFFVLMVVFFIIAPLLEKVLKGQRPQRPGQPGQPGQPRPGMPQQRRRLPDGRTATTRPDATGTATTARDATDLVPADLWEMLTGQRGGPLAQPEPRRTLPEPSFEAQSLEEEAVRKPEAQLSSWAEGAARHNIEHADEVQRRRERERRSYRAPTPTAVSLEVEPLGEKRRHEAFHGKLDRLAPVETVRGRPVRRDLGLDFGSTDSLRRAIILQEVLGRPKGMD